MTVSPSIFPELAEVDAPPPIRAVYAGLREGAASPIAALIWRHIATHPGLLEECWASLSPHFASGRFAQTAWRVARETVPQRLLPRIEPRAQPLLGISPDDAMTFRALAEAYNRANPVNLLAVLTLLARIADDRPAEPDGPFTPSAPPLAITRPLPPMTPPSEMTSAARWLLNDLRFGDRSQLQDVVPSLFRHLTEWPAYLAVLHIALAPRFRDGAMAEAAARVEQAMASEAAILARQIAPVDKLASALELQTTMRRFAAGFIPMMIVVGRAIDEQFS